jgi:hypothetical protein
MRLKIENAYGHPIPKDRASCPRHQASVLFVQRFSCVNKRRYQTNFSYYQTLNFDCEVEEYLWFGGI